MENRQGRCRYCRGEECLRTCWCSILDGPFGLAALTQLEHISSLKALGEIIVDNWSRGEGYEGFR